MTPAVARVRAAIALRDAAFAAIEANKCLDYTDDDLRELVSALIDAAPEMLRAVEELEALKVDCSRVLRLKEQVRRLREALEPFVAVALGRVTDAPMHAYAAAVALLKETAE